jgi:hypothetical protein
LQGPAASRRATRSIPQPPLALPPDLIDWLTAELQLDAGQQDQVKKILDEDCA